MPDSRPFTPQTALDKLLVAPRKVILAAVVLLVLALVKLESAINIEYSLGVLYVLPMILGGIALDRKRIILLAFICAFARGLFTDVPTQLDYVLHFTMASLAYSGCGLFVVELRRNRQMYVVHIAQLERQRALRREAQEQLRMLVESSPAAIMTLDENGHILAANRALVEMLGLTSHSKLVGRSIAPYIPMLTDVLKLGNGDRVFRTAAQCAGHRENGTAFLAQTWFSTYMTGGKKRLAAIAVDSSDEMRDLEEQHLKQIAINHRVLAGAVSHEIRNLCAAANVVFSNLQRKPELANDDDFAALRSLIAGLDSLASFELKSNKNPGSFILTDVLDKFLIIATPGWEDAGGSIEVQVPNDVPPVRGEPAELLQVLLNLSQNSLRAVADSPRKQLRLSVMVTENSDSETTRTITMLVCDSGPGVDHPEALFHPFQPGAHASGLGLYVSRALLQNLGGELRYELSAEGACFAMELPASRVQLV